MTVTVAMHQSSFEHIGAALEELGLDITVHTFDAQGRFRIGGASVRASEVDVDYLWLSNHINAGGERQGVFDTVLACRSIDVLQTFNAGLDEPFYAKIAARGTRIVNSSAQAVAIAEYVMAHVLSLVHPIDRQREQQARRHWELTPFRELSRMRWLIVGFGAIGEAIAARARAFGATIAVVRRTPQTSPLVDDAGTLEDLPRLLPAADVVVIACALTDATRGFADAAFFADLKPGAILVNIARGALVDDTALLAALDGGRLAHAVLDVFPTEPLPAGDPLWTHPRVRVTPHTSFAGDGVRGRWDALFLENIARYVRGEPLVREVDPQDI